MASGQTPDEIRTISAADDVDATYRANAVPLPSSLPPTVSSIAPSPSPTPNQEGASIPVAYPRVEGYRIVGKLGEGGMGTVWEAIQLSTRREVALKLMSERSFASRHAAHRFQREVELAAKLDHSNIAVIYEAGMHKGVYSYAMRLVRGVPLDQYILREKLDPRAILGLMQLVCDAVGHAHEKGILHRDLKPSNVIVDEKGRPFVLDFGLAKAMGDEEMDVSTTHEGDVVGTPAYMSPEQAQGRIHEVDTRTDVYALGVILYMLLTGRHPVDLTGSRFEVLTRIVQEKIKPLREVTTDVDPKLELLVMKALNKDRGTRFADAAELTSAIKKYLSPVENPAPASQASPSARRGLMAVLVAVVVIACAFIFWPREKMGQSTDQVISKDGEAKMAPSNTVISTLPAVWPLGPAENVVPGLIPRPAVLPNVKRWNLETRRPLSRREWPGRLAFDPKGPRLAAVATWGPTRIYELPSMKVAQILPGKYGCIAWSPDSQRIALSVGSSASSIQLWDVTRSAPLHTIEAHTTEAYRLAWALDSKLLATGGYWKDGRIRVWKADGTLVNEINVGRFVTSLTWGPDNLFAGGNELALCVYRHDSPTPVLTLETAEGDKHRELCWSPDGKWLAAGSVLGGDDKKRNLIMLWDAKNGKQHATLEGNLSFVNQLAWSPDSAKLVTAGQDKWVRVFEISGGKNISSFQFPKRTGGYAGINSVSWSADGKWIAAMDEGGFVGLWDSNTYEPGPVVGPVDQSHIEGDPPPMQPSEPVRIVIDASANRVAQFSQAGQFIGSDASILDELVYVVEEEDGSYTTLEHDAFMRRIGAKPTAAKAIELKRGLVAHWAFDDGEGVVARNSTRDAHHGALQNMDAKTAWVTTDLPPMPAGTKNKAALRFDGNNSRVDCDRLGDWGSTRMKSGTIAFWINTTMKEPVRPVAAIGPEGNGFTTWLNGPGDGHGGEAVYFLIHTGADKGHDWILKNQAGQPFAINDGQWHHIALRWDAVGHMGNIYCDGVQLVSSVFRHSPSLPNRNSPLTPTDFPDLSDIVILGGRTDASTPFFNGLLDDVRIYDRMLSEAEIKALAGVGAEKQ